MSRKKFKILECTLQRAELILNFRSSKPVFGIFKWHRLRNVNLTFSPGELHISQKCRGVSTCEKPAVPGILKKYSEVSSSL